MIPVRFLNLKFLRGLARDDRIQIHRTGAGMHFSKMAVKSWSDCAFRITLLVGSVLHISKEAE